MTRTVAMLVNDHLVERLMPHADEEVMSGVAWGDPWTVFTPAYWLAQAWMTGITPTCSSRYRSQNGVVSELVFCLLGGFGITAELATAAFETCGRAGLIERQVSDSAAWTSVLRAPLNVNGRMVHYRYPNQKARFLAEAMRLIKTSPLRLDDGHSLRNQLLVLPGVGYKTASWVVRNVMDCDQVAILDIHLIRAGRLCGLFSKEDRVDRNYLDMEARFLKFAHALNLRPAALDCLIWDQMRAAGDLPMKMLDQASDPFGRGRQRDPAGAQLRLAV